MNNFEVFKNELTVDKAIALFRRADCCTCPAKDVCNTAGDMPCEEIFRTWAETEAESHEETLPRGRCVYKDENGICAKLSDHTVRQSCIEGPCEWANDPEPPKQDNRAKMYVCTQRCPELDYDNEPHCRTADPKNAFSDYPDRCPVGNRPIWTEMTEGDHGAQS